MSHCEGSRCECEAHTQCAERPKQAAPKQPSGQTKQANHAKYYEQAMVMRQKVLSTRGCLLHSCAEHNAEEIYEPL